MHSTDYAKELAARAALDFIENGMVVGLGTGTTANRFIELLGERVRSGLKIRAIPSSKASAALAASLAIPIVNFQQCPEIDVAIDGADEIAPGLALIKGGHGALLLEKLVASAAKRFIVIADSSKVVPRLGNAPLPIAVIPVAAPVVGRRLGGMRFEWAVRRLSNGSEFITDEGNLIIDCRCGFISHPDALAASIRNIVGVVEHGLFLHMAERALVSDGSKVTTLFK